MDKELNQIKASLKRIGRIGLKLNKFYDGRISMSFPEDVSYVGKLRKELDQVYQECQDLIDKAKSRKRKK